VEKRNKLTRRVTARFTPQELAEIERASLVLKVTRSDLVVSGTIAEIRRRLAGKTQVIETRESAGFVG